MALRRHRLALGTTEAAASAPVTSPYLSGRFIVHKLAREFSQDPSWTRNGKVLSSQFDAAGIKQIYRARADGKHQTCLTCRTATGPMGFPRNGPMASGSCSSPTANNRCTSVDQASEAMAGICT